MQWRTDGELKLKKVHLQTDGRQTDKGAVLKWFGLDGVEVGRRKTDHVEDYGGVLPPWFGESGEGRQGKRANLGKEKCEKIIGELTMGGLAQLQLLRQLCATGGP